MTKKKAGLAKEQPAERTDDPQRALVYTPPAQPDGLQAVIARVQDAAAPTERDGDMAHMGQVWIDLMHHQPDPGADVETFEAARAWGAARWFKRLKEEMLEFERLAGYAIEYTEDHALWQRLGWTREQFQEYTGFDEAEWRRLWYPVRVVEPKLTALAEVLPPEEVAEIRNTFQQLPADKKKAVANIASELDRQRRAARDETGAVLPLAEALAPLPEFIRQVEVAPTKTDVRALEAKARGKERPEPLWKTVRLIVAGQGEDRQVQIEGHFRWTREQLAGLVSGSLFEAFSFNGTSVKPMDLLAELDRYGTSDEPPVDMNAMVVDGGLAREPEPEDEQRAGTLGDTQWVDGTDDLGW